MSMMIASCPALVNPVPTVAEEALADRLAFLADGGNPEEYRAGWDGDDSQLFAPSLADSWYETGRSIGIDGSIVAVGDVFPDTSERDLVLGAFSFSEGLHDGLRIFAKRVGYERGIAGESCERPELIPSRLDMAFQSGWHKGNGEFEERAAILADFHQKLDWEAAYEQEMRDVEALNREVYFGRLASMVD